MRTGLYIGRFQPFHKGHLHAVRYCLSIVEQLIIGIGSALESHTTKNPFTAGERIEMISLALEEAKIKRDCYLLIPIPDVGHHQLWVPLVEILTPPFEVVFSNEPLTRRLFKERGYSVEKIPFMKRELYSGEEFRRRVVSGENWTEIVTKSVARFLEEKGLLQRIVELSESDKARL